MQKTKTFRWPDGKRAAISLSFDDARVSQIDTGMAILDKHAVKATFYITLKEARKRLGQWKAALTNGHEIGNHTLTHPCSGNFPFATLNPLEEYTLERMKGELTGASDAVEELFGIRPSTFAYPCGQTYVGRGEDTRSYVPMVAKHFEVGRRAFDEIPNDPRYCDLACTTGLDFDGMTWEQFLNLIELTISEGRWLILFGHEVQEPGRQAVLPATLEQACEYCQDANNGLWIDTVATIGSYVRKTRSN